MKKQIYTFLATSAVVGLFPSVAQATYPIPSYVDVVLNGEKVDFPDVQPFIDASGRTLVPVRFVSESMGGHVTWQADTQMVDIQWKGKDIRLKVGDDTATVDQVNQTLDTAVTMQDGRTFVPLRFVSETMGATVKWDSSADTVQITTADFTPDPNAKYDAYGRLIRTTNLPSNAKDFSYILADMPNDFYEMSYNSFFDPSKGAQVPAVLLAKTPQLTKSNIDLTMGRVRTYFNTLFNVDYQTIDYSYADLLSSNANQSQDYSNDMKKYVDWVKQDQIQMEGYVDPEPSVMYYDGWGNWYVRSKYKVMIKHMNTANYQFGNSENPIYGIHYVKLKNLQADVWYEGYVDVPLCSNVWGDGWGDTLYVDDSPVF